MFLESLYLFNSKLYTKNLHEFTYKLHKALIKYFSEKKIIF